MASDIKLTDNTIILEGAEVQNTGSNAGYAFHDRTKPDAERWVLYSSDQKARLWAQSTSQNVLTVTADGVVGVGVSDPPPTKGLYLN